MIDIAYAMAPPSGGGADNTLMAFLPMILIFGVFYFLMIRPQQKKAKEHKSMIENLKKGDKIITSGGVYGIIESVGTNTITVKISENVKVKFGKGYVATVRASSDEE